MRRADRTGYMILELQGRESAHAPPPLKRGMRHYRRAPQARRVSGGMEPEVVRVCLLGGFRVSVGSLTIEASGWRLRKARSLVKLLALARGHRLHRGRSWTCSGRTSRPRLSATTSTTPFTSPVGHSKSPLQTPPATFSYRETYSPCALMERCGWTPRPSRRPPPLVAAYRAAIELYAGELLPEDLYEEWTQERRAKLRRTYLELLVELAGLHEEREEYEPASKSSRWRSPKSRPEKERTPT